MRIWIDTEFNGFNGELLSMALVAEDGEVFYRVLPYEFENLVEWVKLNVSPTLRIGPEEDERYTSVDIVTFQSHLSSFLNRYDEIEIIADWPEDITHLMKMMITGPGMMIMTPNVMNFTVDRTLESESEIPHNAYYDALANMQATLNKELDVA